MLVLVDSKKDQQHQALLDSSRDRMKTAEQKWSEIAVMCNAANVNRNWNQCKKRWEKLITEFKKIFDFQANTPSGGDGYFQLTRSERKEQGLPTTFQEDIFDAMMVFVPGNRAVNPHPSQYVDSTADAEAEQLLRRRTAPRPSSSDVRDEANPCRFDGYEDLDSSEEVHEDSYVPSETPTQDPTPPASEEIGGNRSTPTQPIHEDQYTPTQPINSSNPSHGGGSSEQGDAGASTSRGWKRKQASERVREEMQRVTTQFIGAISEDREARREEHTQLLQFYNTRHNETLAASIEATRSTLAANMEATRSARQTGIDVAKALMYMGDAVWHNGDPSRRPPNT